MTTEFNDWLNKILSKDKFSKSTAFNFNLSEENDSFQIQFISTFSYNKDDEDWACDEDYTSKKLFILPRQTAGETWQQGLEFCSNLVKEYLNNGEYSYFLKEKEAVGIGFIDGDIKIVYENPRP